MKARFQSFARFASLAAFPFIAGCAHDEPASTAPTAAHIDAASKHSASASKHIGKAQDSLKAEKVLQQKILKELDDAIGAQ